MTRPLTKEQKDGVAMTSFIFAVFFLLNGIIIIDEAEGTPYTLIGLLNFIFAIACALSGAAVHRR